MTDVPTTHTNLDRRAFVLAGAATFAMTVVPTAGAQDAAFRQKVVDDLVVRIANAVDTSLDTADWRRNYDQAKRNIEDLKKALPFGGKVTSNPIANFKGKLDSLLGRAALLAHLSGRKRHPASAAERRRKSPSGQ